MKKFSSYIKDLIVGFIFGLAGIIPGIAGGTVLLVSGTYKKIVAAVSNLFSKNFVRNFLILLPFGIGAIIAVAAFVYPINIALHYCLFAIVSLFAGLIIGTYPSLVDKIKAEPKKKSFILTLIISFVIAGIIGIFSIVFNTNTIIENLFANRPYYIYFIVFFVGLICSSGLIIPGFSGSMLLLVLCFYKPILNTLKFGNFWSDFSIICALLVGAIIGFILFSKLMNFMFSKHPIGTYYCSMGLVAGSLVSIFVNAEVIDYLKSDSFQLLDKILGPILLLIGVVVGYLIVHYLRKHPEIEENA